MDGNMYVIMRYHWSTNGHEPRWDDVEAAAMSVDSANRYVQNWKCPDGEYEPIEEETKLDSKGRMWRFFEVKDGRMTMRIDSTLLV
jgi:hypothetical protein